MILPLLSALIVALAQCALYYAGSPMKLTTFFGVHIFALVTIVFLTNQNALRKAGSAGFPELMREGFKRAAIYSLLVAAFTWIYYKVIDTQYFEQEINKRVHMGVLEGQAEKVIRPKLMAMFTVFNFTSFTFFAFLIVGAVLSLSIAALHHKVLRRFVR